MGWLQKISNWLGFYPSYPPPIRCLPLYAEMKAKDPELLDAIGHMTLWRGILEWQKTYPEDFPDPYSSITTVGMVKPKSE
jgi:hypothetical protein